MWLLYEQLDCRWGLHGAWGASFLLTVEGNARGEDTLVRLTRLRLKVVTESQLEVGGLHT